MRIPFGKYKGQELRFVPHDYLVWLCESGGCQSDALFEEIVRILRYAPDRKLLGQARAKQKAQRRKLTRKAEKKADPEEKKVNGPLIYPGGPFVPAATQPPPETVFHSDRDVPPWYIESPGDSDSLERLFDESWAKDEDGFDYGEWR